MIFDMPSCGGCRTCEMACSFHHRGEFVPAISSIGILEKVNEPGFLVVLREKNEGEGMACDGCRGLNVPLCLEYCEKREDLEKILTEFLTNAGLREESKAGSKRLTSSSTADRGLQRK